MQTTSTVSVVTPVPSRSLRLTMLVAAVLAALALVLAGPVTPAASASDGALVLAVEEAVDSDAAAEDAGPGSGAIVFGLLVAVGLMGLAFARISAQD